MPTKAKLILVSFLVLLALNKLTKIKEYIMYAVTDVINQASRAPKKRVKRSQ